MLHACAAANAGTPAGKIVLSPGEMAYACQRYGGGVKDPGGEFAREVAELMRNQRVANAFMSPLAASQANLQAAWAQMAAMQTSAAMPLGGGGIPKVENVGLTLGEIIAHRVWLVRGDHLTSVHMGTIWYPDTPMTGIPGDHDCLGAHAWKTLTGALAYASNEGVGHGVYRVIGRVSLWGDVVEHETGYRAASARIHALDAILAPSRPNGPLLTVNHEPVLDTLRKTYAADLARATQPLTES